MIEEISYIFDQFLKSPAGVIILALIGGGIVNLISEYLRETKPRAKIEWSKKSDEFHYRPRITQLKNDAWILNCTINGKNVIIKQMLVEGEYLDIQLHQSSTGNESLSLSYRRFKRFPSPLIQSNSNRTFYWATISKKTLKQKFNRIIYKLRKVKKTNDFKFLSLIAFRVYEGFKGEVKLKIISSSDQDTQIKIQKISKDRAQTEEVRIKADRSFVRNLLKEADIVDSKKVRRDLLEYSISNEQLLKLSKVARKYSYPKRLTLEEWRVKMLPQESPIRVNPIVKLYTQDKSSYLSITFDAEGLEQVKIEPQNSWAMDNNAILVRLSNSSTILVSRTGLVIHQSKYETTKYYRIDRANASKVKKLSNEVLKKRRQIEYLPILPLV